MRVGVTGSRTDRPQRTILRLGILLREWGCTELHHGDCQGFDAQAHQIAAQLGIRIVIHPPTDARLRAFCEGHETLPPLPYIKRNRAIVDATERLIAAPDGPERQRSGTWSTVRYAKKVEKRGVVLKWPE